MLKKYIIILAASTSVIAVKFGNPSFTGITVGELFDITWLDASGSVTITLKNGAATSLKDVETIASGLSGTSFSWTPSSSLLDGPYALEITDSTGPNYSIQFTIDGASSLSSALSSKSSTLSSAAFTTASALETSRVSATIATSTTTPSATSLMTVSSSISAESASITSTASSANSAKSTSNTGTTKTTHSSNTSSSTAKPTASTNGVVRKDSNDMNLSLLAFFVFGILGNI